MRDDGYACNDPPTRRVAIVNAHIAGDPLINVSQIPSGRKKVVVRFPLPCIHYRYSECDYSDVDLIQMIPVLSRGEPRFRVSARVNPRY